MKLHYMERQCPRGVPRIHLHPLYRKTVATPALEMNGRIWRCSTSDRHHFGSVSQKPDVLPPRGGGSFPCSWKAKCTRLGPLLGLVMLALWPMVCSLHTKRNQLQIGICIQPAWVKSLRHFRNKLVGSRRKQIQRVCACVLGVLRGGGLRVGKRSDIHLCEIIFICLNFITQSAKV